MDIGTRIKNLREESGLTQLAFAKILNINNSTLCQYENGDRVPSDDIKGRIADYFCVSMDYLMGRTNIREKLPAYSGERRSPDGYDRLTAANRMIVDHLIAELAKSQSGE